MPGQRLGTSEQLAKGATETLTVQMNNWLFPLVFLLPLPVCAYRFPAAFGRAQSTLKNRFRPRKVFGEHAIVDLSRVNHGRRLDTAPDRPEFSVL